MTDFLVKRSEASAPYVHDWLAGHLTEMTRTSASLDNRAPFGLSEVVAVWGDHAEKKVFQPASLVGYQVVGEDGSYPFGLTSCDVIRSRQDALDRLNGASDESPAGGFGVYPVYEGEIPSPSFI